ncbi:hypothetical protein [Erythrobacter aureus]|uniref:Uncharacterized protein n=1 Tax=Erythrobacter aureus TaxID=2182384 RepID=A0A345YIZ9_9SPHN|nr:hypothetical protein [Erythrobacter aureus]AXK43901.1 hypothetical protein DVR09_15720 [Erythrobacter aureus]
MRIKIDASKLHLIANHNRGSLLGLLARRFASEDCSFELEEPELAALARNHPDALGCLLCQTTFAAGSESPTWAFNIEGSWRTVSQKDPRILFEMLGDGAKNPDIASQVHAFHSPATDLTVYWCLGWEGLNTIFHSPSFTIQNDDRGKEGNWKFIDLDAQIQRRWDYNELVAQGIITPVDNGEMKTSS